MELLMGRAEEERRALEAEVAAMRASAGAAAPQLLLAEEEVSVRICCLFWPASAPLLAWHRCLCSGQAALKGHDRRYCSYCMRCICGRSKAQQHADVL